MTARTLGDQELTLLRFVAEHGPISVGEAVEKFGTPRGLARSTVLTVMERLRKKRRLTRRRSGGVYLYASVEAPHDLLHGVVRTFVDTALSGSVSPFVTYLTESATLSDSELAELELLVSKLKKGKDR